MELSQFAKDYLYLGLRINKHINGYVEHYYGPSNIKSLVDLEETISPKKLLTDCDNLLKNLPDQGFNEKRKEFLFKNLIAIKAILRKLSGDHLLYLELVEKLFDFQPVFYEDKYFYELASHANELYQGNGSLSERIERYGNQRKISLMDLKTSFIKALKIVSKKTIKVFPDFLPEKERVEVTEVKNQSWLMYCWYQGNYSSRIEINLDRIHYWTNLLYDACHEGYPGHHTERSVREDLLYRKNNIFECSILLIYTPEMVISEGIAVTAERVIFNPNESVKILLEELNPRSDDDLEILIKQDEIRKGFRRLESNLAYHKYVHGWSDKEIIKFLKDLEIIGDNVIDGILAFISDDIWAPYIQTYQGERLIVNKFGKKPSPLSFRRIIAEQTLPSDLI